MDIRYISSAGYQLWAGATGEGEQSGSIQLEFGWQLIAVPVEFGYWDASAGRHIHDNITVAKFENYILDQLTDVYGTGIVEVANTYTGDNQFFWNYVVNSTPASSPHNFQLVYNDGVYKEISGMWIKIIGPAAPYIYRWGET